MQIRQIQNEKKTEYANKNGGADAKQTSIWATIGKKDENFASSISVSKFASKQLLLHTLAPAMLSSIRLRLKSGDLESAQEQMRLLIKEAENSSLLGLLPLSAKSQYWALSKEIEGEIKEADARNDIDHIKSLFLLYAMLQSLRFEKVNGYA
jgi:hypothetical protein